jgi:hypothetical protein
MAAIEINLREETGKAVIRGDLVPIGLVMYDVENDKLALVIVRNPEECTAILHKFGIVTGIIS